MPLFSNIDSSHISAGEDVYPILLKTQWLKKINREERIKTLLK